MMDDREALRRVLVEGRVVHDHAHAGAFGFVHRHVGRAQQLVAVGPVLGIDEIAPAKPGTGDVVGKLFPQKPSRFVLAVRTADSLTVKGVATEEGDFADFENADGRRGRIQVSIAVTPKRIKVTFDN